MPNFIYKWIISFCIILLVLQIRSSKKNVMYTGVLRKSYLIYIRMNMS